MHRECMSRHSRQTCMRRWSHRLAKGRAVCRSWFSLRAMGSPTTDDSSTTYKSLSEPGASKLCLADMRKGFRHLCFSCPHGGVEKGSNSGSMHVEMESTLNKRGEWPVGSTADGGSRRSCPQAVSSSFSNRVRVCALCSWRFRPAFATGSCMPESR